jgi:hypothetical protein
MRNKRRPAREQASFPGSRLFASIGATNPRRRGIVCTRFAGSLSRVFRELSEEFGGQRVGNEEFRSDELANKRRRLDKGRLAPRRAQVRTTMRTTTAERGVTSGNAVQQRSPRPA